MGDNDCDCIECAESVAEKRQGKPDSACGILGSFALYGLKKRVAALERLDAELRDEMDSDSSSLRRRVQLMELRRKMGSVHEALRKAKR